MNLDTRYPAYFFHVDGSLKRIESMAEEDALDKSVWSDKQWPPKGQAAAPAAPDDPVVFPVEIEPADEPADPLPDDLDDYTVKESEAVLVRPDVTPERVQKWLDHEHDGKGRLGLIALLKAKLDKE